MTKKLIIAFIGRHIHRDANGKKWYFCRMHEESRPLVNTVWDEDIVLQPCAVCNGWWVGKNPKGATRAERRKQYNSELKARGVKRNRGDRAAQRKRWKAKQKAAGKPFSKGDRAAQAKRRRERKKEKRKNVIVIDVRGL